MWLTKNARLQWSMCTTEKLCELPRKWTDVWRMASAMVSEFYRAWGIMRITTKMVKYLLCHAQTNSTKVKWILPSLNEIYRVCTLYTLYSLKCARLYSERRMEMWRVLIGDLQNIFCEMIVEIKNWKREIYEKKRKNVSWKMCVCCYY